MALSMASLGQLSINAGGCLEFLRETATLGAPSLVFTQSRRLVVRREVLRHVTLCQRRRAWIASWRDGTRRARRVPRGRVSAVGETRRAGSGPPRRPPVRRSRRGRQERRDTAPRLGSRPR